jgi:hypothetical protein
VTDDRYTVDDPPKKGNWVYIPWVTESGVGASWYRHDTDLPVRDTSLDRGLVHRTRESAEAHAKRMLMADDILEALEMLLQAQTSESPTWREHVTRGARAVAAKARGEVGG